MMFLMYRVLTHMLESPLRNKPTHSPLPRLAGMSEQPRSPVSADPFSYPKTGSLFKRAQHVCREAEITSEKVALTLADCRRLRLERRQWKAIWSALRARPDHFLTQCSYCTRVRTSSGEWSVIPGGASESLHRSPAVNLSHGICPDCL